ncbi:ribosome hibernation-promoting factor, HPF/YfiA family [Criibacterium bergeronii]|uniref:Ribosome hibernation promoting factor n=1 Tax=Criibacterium bergeronii TaxID=1871336 RepID=A0A371IPD3_9FIRM|nr:ribosome-associated translation inhibitor RaiA [Criibacterium bergeronii]MBS6063478.1 ribosome-associated translation inhibitor RaiA [Peptostreptococcaceae bacterium]RDY22300.1 ribosome-associated translation inhibitor RaiA [Criibacterium bergeronii]TRW28795.1 ribosome-associated translation inhibitor RaiA [Criibacterium bergeronii]
MKIILSAKQIKLSDKQKEVITKKLERLDKYFQNDVIVRATVSSKKNHSSIEVTIPVNKAVMRAEASDYDMYSSVDEVVSKLAKQLRKYKTRLQDKGNETIRFENVENFDEFALPESMEESKIVKRKSFDYLHMTEEEAIMQMDLVGHNFFIFKNPDDNKVNVVYRRNDGGFGIIEQAD